MRASQDFFGTGDLAIGVGPFAFVEGAGRRGRPTKAVENAVGGVPKARNPN